ncbi:MAG TPA: PIG-L family deacetylase [Acidimicrobiia bacterium]|nr:PIG-L family deacetylase [Acidimicrobiia bacterium]
MKVLAIGAHPDDVELGVGGTLVRHIARGDEVTLLVMTRGELGIHEDSSRSHEQLRASEALGATLLWGDFHDGAVPAGADAITLIDDALRRTGASLVYTHAPDDTHQDHRATSIASLAAARRVSTVLYYETPSTQHFQPTLFVDIEESLRTKVELLRAHLSQVLRDGPVDIEAVVAQARFRGSQSRVRHAEAFESARFVWDLVPDSAHDDAVLDALEAEPAAATSEVRSIVQAVRELVR